MGLIKTFILIIILLGSASAQEASEWLNYANLKKLTDKYGMSHERDALTDREIFSGNSSRIITCPGMHTMWVNGQLIILSDYVKAINGEIFIPNIDFPKIETFLKESPVTSVNTHWRLKKVVIDPGHGGDFTGARGVDGTLEKEVNLDIALKLRDLLAREGIEVVMTRTRDIHLSPHLDEDLNRRVAIANREQPDLFISIHADWIKQSGVYGFTIYYSPGKPVSQSRLRQECIGQKDELDRATRAMLAGALRDEYQKETLDFAREVRKSFQILPTKDLGIREADYRVIKNTECPSVLVEVDFLSNRAACRKLASPGYRREIAERLAAAVLAYQNQLTLTEGFTK